MQELPKQLKRALRGLAATAQEEELRRALLQLADKFETWKSGKLSSGDLVDAIHAFHEGPARQILLKYDRQNLLTTVAQAIAIGVVAADKVPAEVLAHLAELVEFFRSAEAGDGS